MKTHQTITWAILLTVGILMLASAHPEMGTVLICIAVLMVVAL